jgi:hypothetical protein
MDAFPLKFLNSITDVQPFKPCKLVPLPFIVKEFRPIKYLFIYLFVLFDCLKNKYVYTLYLNLKKNGSCDIEYIYFIIPQ